MGKVDTGHALQTCISDPLSADILTQQLRAQALKALSKVLLLQALWQAARLEADGVQDATLEQLAASAVAARDALPDMLSAATKAGWNTDDVPIRGGPCRLDLE